VPPVHNIYGDQPYEYEVDLEKRRGTDGALIPATGLLDVYMTVAAAPGGAEINPALTVAMAERSAMPGRYYGTIPTVAVNTWLKGTYNRKKVQVVAYNTAADVRVESEVTMLDVRAI
jgi:hypothetical protein